MTDPPLPAKRCGSPAERLPRSSKPSARHIRGGPGIPTFRLSLPPCATSAPAVTRAAASPATCLPAHLSVTSCGRFGLTDPLRDTAAEPAERRVDVLRWGLFPGWAKDAKIGNALANARAETIATKPSVRGAWKAARRAWTCRRQALSTRALAHIRDLAALGGVVMTEERAIVEQVSDATASLDVTARRHEVRSGRRRAATLPRPSLRIYDRREQQ